MTPDLAALLHEWADAALDGERVTITPEMLREIATTLQRLREAEARMVVRESTHDESERTMTIKWTPDGKVDRDWRVDALASPAYCDDLADTLDECVSALRQCLDFWRASGSLTADDVQTNVESVLRKIGAEPSDDPICMSCGQRKPKCGVGC